MKNVNVIDVMDAAAKTCRTYDHQKSANDLPKARDSVFDLISSSELVVKVIRNLVSSGQIDERYGMYADDLDKAVAATKGESRE